MKTSRPYLGSARCSYNGCWATWDVFSPGGEEIDEDILIECPECGNYTGQLKGGDFDGDGLKRRDFGTEGQEPL